MIESRCGVLCSACIYRESTGCVGCVTMAKPFWGECLVKTCCEGKGLSHCGECSSFPCDVLTGYAYEKEHGDDGKRIAQCACWKEGK